MAKKTLETITHSPDETSSLGKRLARLLEPGDVVAISGELGSGKTVMVQGICSGLGVKQVVTSPTFALIQEYRGRCPVYHVDFYRLESLRDIEDLDLFGYFESGGVSLIEWADRAEAFLPRDRITIRMDRMVENERPDENKRRIRIDGLRGKVEL